jgi:hypothetical protein
MVTKHRNLGWKAWSKKQKPKPTASLQLHTSVMGRLPTTWRVFKPTAIIRKKMHAQKEYRQQLNKYVLRYKRG